MSVNYESDSTYCSIFESRNKRFSKVTVQSTSKILDSICQKIKNHVDRKQLLNPFEVIKYKQQISTLRFNSYKLKFLSEKIKMYLNGIYKQSKSIEEIIKLQDILLDNTDPLLDCSISQDLRILNDYKNDLNPIALPAQTDIQSLSFNTDMLSNQLFITDSSQNSANTSTAVVNTESISNPIYVNVYDESENCELNLVNRKSQNTDVISVVSCTETVQKDHDESVSNQNLVNITNSEESIMLINNVISENVTTKGINKHIGLIPTNCSSFSFKSDMLSNQIFLVESTKSSDTPLGSQDLFTQEEINLEVTKSECETNNLTELLELTSSPTKALNQIDKCPFNSVKKYYNKRLFNIVTNTTNTMISSSSRGIMSTDKTEPISSEERSNIITSINSNCDTMDIDSNTCSDEIFKKPFIIKRKPIVSNNTQIPSSSSTSDLKKSDQNDIGNLKPLNECEELCNLTKKFLNIVEATDDDSKKTIEVFKNISNPFSKKEFQTVSEIGSENWEHAGQKLEDTNYLHQEISDWLQDILDNISNEDKTKTKETFNSLEYEVANCLRPEDILDLDIRNLFRSNYRRLKEMANGFKRKLILDDFKSITRNEDPFKGLSCFDWKKIL